MFIREHLTCIFCFARKVLKGLPKHREDKLTKELREILENHQEVFEGYLRYSGDKEMIEKAGKMKKIE